MVIRSGCLALAVAVLAALALAPVPLGEGPGRAQAQEEEEEELCETTIWTGTLTVGASGVTRGFDSTPATPANRYGSVTPSTFEYRGVTFTVRKIQYYRSGANEGIQTQFRWPSNPAAWSPQYALYFDGVKAAQGPNDTQPLSPDRSLGTFGAPLGSNNSQQALTGSNVVVPTWNTGDTVTVRLTALDTCAGLGLAVVRIQTEADNQAAAGTYTVSWETRGGCDPGPETSGDSGSVTLTVADKDGAGPNTVGDQQETGIVANNICTYAWSAAFTNAAGVACVVGGAGTADDATTGAALEVSSGVLGLATGACATTGRLNVTVKGHGVNVGDCVPAPNDDGGYTDAACETADTNTPVAGGYRLAAAADASDSALAASATTFTVTATPQEVGGKVPDGCHAVSGDTQADDNSLQKVTLTVADVALGGISCMYTVTAALPAGFVAGDGTARSTGNSQKDRDPNDAAGEDSVVGTADDVIVSVPDLIVSIAAVKVYLVQNVIGDAGGANAEYKYTAPCGAPGLPGALTRIPESGGITRVGEKTVVELRTGRYNISEVLPDGTAADGTLATALDKAGKACEATIAVSGVPTSCSISHNSPASLASASGSVIVEVTIDCSPPPAPEPPAEEPMGDTGDMGGGDMGDGDMAGGDMGDGDMAGDMGTGDTGGDDMAGGDTGDTGPRVDTPTG